MTVISKVLDYINFFVYCKKKKTFCKGYRRLRENKVKGYINQREYAKSLRNIYNAVIELELDYFDIRHMRL
ncbi:MULTISPECIES: hypothetical protein [Flavobacteriaceae]|uniref:hypothetical protein n=1 Tax=Flavobacteriaceae TaxID=49546 RepID=UPI00234A0B49|nr:hypothetical protein [Muricauda sp. SP22]MDC6362974.1 hypothetical protein [Muricauda sp. SP22]